VTPGANQLLDAFLLDPDNLPARYAMTIVLQLHGVTPSSTDAKYADLVRLNPDSVENQISLGTVLGKHRYPAAGLRRMEQAVQAHPDSPLARDQLGVTMFNMGRVQEGIAHCEAALRMMPDADAIEQDLRMIYSGIGLDPAVAERRIREIRRKP
jgi:predicted Zn-dependent protease